MSNLWKANSKKLPQASFTIPTQVTRNVVDGILCSNSAILFQNLKKIDNVKHIICENSNKIKNYKIQNYKKRITKYNLPYERHWRNTLLNHC